MKSRAYIILIIAILIAFCQTSFAAGQPQASQFGYVNVADAMLLHPTMRYFDPISKRFKLGALKGIDQEKRVEENRINFKANLDKLENNLNELEAERINLEEDYNNQLESVKNSEKNKYLEKKLKIDKKYNNDADELRKKIYYAKQKIESFKKNSIYTSYTTQLETSQLFSLMLDDVYDAMGAVAKHYNVSFVFNSSAEISYLEGRIMTANPMSEFFEKFDENPNDSEKKKITGAAFYSWLGEKNSTFLNCNDRRLSSFVMMGGLNMTPAVIDYIYQKHKVGKAQRDFVLEFFDKIMNGKAN